VSSAFAHPVEPPPPVVEQPHWQMQTQQEHVPWFWPHEISEASASVGAASGARSIAQNARADRRLVSRRMVMSKWLVAQGAAPRGSFMTLWSRRQKPFFRAKKSTDVDFIPKPTAVVVRSWSVSLDSVLVRLYIYGRSLCGGKGVR